MSEGPRETEVKFRLRDRASFEARLRARGAVAGPLEEEVNILLDDAARTIYGSGRALRVRTVGATGTLTFKGEATFTNGVKSRLELETGVDAPERTIQILTALGLTAWFRYDKRRTTWRFQDPARPLVVVDETPLGLFAEIEGDDGAVRQLAKELDVDEGEFLTGSYLSLYQEARRRDPSLPRDMVFPS